MNISSQRQQIRQLIRKKRQKLTALEQAQAEQNITQKALAVIEQFQAEHIALYRSFDGEISTKLLIEKLWQQGKKVYLPVLHPFSDGNLLFLAFNKDTPMQQNKFGIFEPKLDVRNVLPLYQLDLIFTPLVAFDKKGNRLGMGGGFYDRTLQDWRQKTFIPIGLAHRCQEVEELPVENWDIPLADILTG
ncbi:5-formyltetrahydrofolate cyclo-ligase [Canicola haemoglobinophilus]|uniref:5-formyltetrahydrofolate cyclo-ligase n=1 Tax=Canicola haemoglobinophilus TaxID=733 RepID=A0AB38H833_9PAST|nr:5-formyltetrahydrofolate cyclo-ligase [Canicola haemoglobinophilus]STO55471.1 5-formyltetrahydrofolate cyclo-ligase [Canicola haemoglobinophilus]STO67799.1 5-formyltetrahydrofolate cyclo-ligase [Canicola haemoglobinophilus]